MDLSPRESIMTLFDPLLATQAIRRSATDATYVRAHKILFSGHDRDRFDESVAASSHPSDCFRDALDLAARTQKALLRGPRDTNILPYLHTALAFMLHMSSVQDMAAHLEDQVPWKVLYHMLSILANCSPTLTPPAPTLMPEPATESSVSSLPEDWAMRGLVFTERHFPSDWFAGDPSSQPFVNDQDPTGDGVLDVNHVLPRGPTIRSVEPLARCVLDCAANEACPQRSERDGGRRVVRRRRCSPDGERRHRSGVVDPDLLPLGHGICHPPRHGATATLHFGAAEGVRVRNLSARCPPLRLPGRPELVLCRRPGDVWSSGVEHQPVLDACTV